MKLNVAVAVLSAVLALLLARYLINVTKQYLRLRHIKGPFGSGWSRWFIISSTYNNTLHLDFAAAIKKYGILEHC